MAQAQVIADRSPHYGALQTTENIASAVGIIASFTIAGLVTAHRAHKTMAKRRADKYQESLKENGIYAD